MIIDLLCLAITIYYYVLLAAIIVSLALAFGWRPPAGLFPVMEVIRKATEPVLGLLRRYIPPIGGLDLTPLVVFIALRVAGQAIGC